MFDPKLTEEDRHQIRIAKAHLAAQCFSIDASPAMRDTGAKAMGAIGKLLDIVDRYEAQAKYVDDVERVKAMHPAALPDAPRKSLREVFAENPQLQPPPVEDHEKYYVEYEKGGIDVALALLVTGAAVAVAAVVWAVWSGIGVGGL